jgi:hypothetical protein
MEKLEDFGEWKSMECINCPNYEASNKGYIRNVRTGRISEGSLSGDGYFRTSLTNMSGKSFKIYVHVIVAKTFLGPPPTQEHTVDHIDGDGTNNDISNLRWATKSEQSLNRRCKDRIAHSRPITQMDLDGNELFTWFSQEEIFEEYGRTNKMSAACQINMTLYGYKWKYCMNDIEGEEWKILPDEFGGVYVSNMGRYRKLINDFVGFGTTTVSGYKTVSITLNNQEQKRFLVHCLVALAFYGKCEEGFLVNHKNGNKKDNKLSNLEYSTPKENTRHAVETGLRKYTKNTKVSRKVHQLDMNGKFIKEFPSISEAHRELKLGGRGISLVCTGKQFTAGGFKWKYAPQEIK